MSEPNLMTAEEIALRLKLRRSTILIWTRLGRIPSIRVSYKVHRYEWQAVVDAILARQTHRGANSCTP